MTDEKIKAFLKTISGNLSEKTLGKAEQMSYDEIHATGLPRQIRNFLLTELEFTARTYLKNIKSVRFNFQDDAIAGARNEFVRHLLKTVILKREDYQKLLDTAVVIQFRYLTRPQKMLSELVFGQKSEQSAAEIIERLQNFSDYRYLINIFLQYIEKKKVETIGREKFEKIISSIDQKIADNYDDHDFLMLLKPIYEFFDLGSESEVPVSILTEFIREKNVARLEKMLYELTAKGVKTLSLKDIDLLLHGRNEQLFEEALIIKEGEPAHTPPNVLPEPPEMVTPSPVQEPEVLSQPTPEATEEPAMETSTGVPEFIPKEVLAPAVPAQAVAEKNLLPEKDTVTKKFDEADIAEQIKESLAAFTPVPKPKKTELDLLNMTVEPQPGLPENTMILDDSNVPDQSPQELGLESTLSLLSKVPPSLPQPQPSSKIDVSEDFLETVVPEKPAGLPKPRDPEALKDLRELIGEADRKKFIKRIFRGKEDAYEEAMSQLNGSKNWREASLYIDEEIFLRHKVDEYSPEAVLFTDIVFSRYKNQSR